MYAEFHEKGLRKRHRWLWVVGVLLVIAILAVLGIAGYVGWNLVHPERNIVDRTPASVGLEYSDISFVSREDGLELKGWLLPSQNSDRTIIVAHGYRKNRLQDDVPVLSLAKDLVGAGYNVLLFDFRNSGESAGNKTSVGQYEVLDLLGAIDFVRQNPEISRRIALLGFSMGASTAIMAGAREPKVDVVIADSPFADLTRYLNANLSVWSNLPPFPFNAAIMFELPLLTGLVPTEVSPVREVPSLAPRSLLLIHGEADTDIPAANSEEILRAAGSNATLWTVPGAKHVKSYATAGTEYSNRIISLLDDVLS